MQGDDYFKVNGTPASRRERRGAAHSPDSLLVSDYPERLEENGVLFTRRSARRRLALSVLPLQSARPARPPHRAAGRERVRPNRRSCSSSRAAGPGRTRWRSATSRRRRFLVRVVQNEGRLITIPAELDAQYRRTRATRRHRRLQSAATARAGGSAVHLTLVAQNADAPDRRSATLDLLAGDRRTRAASIRFPSSTTRRSGTSTGDYSRCRSAKFRCRTCARRGARRRLRRVAIVHRQRTEPEARRRNRSRCTQIRAAAARPERTSSTACSCSRIKCRRSRTTRFANTRPRARLRAHDDRHDAGRRLDLSAAAHVRPRRRQRLARRARLADLLSARARVVVASASRRALSHAKRASRYGARAAAARASSPPRGCRAARRSSRHRRRSGRRRVAPATSGNALRSAATSGMPAHSACAAA